MLLETARMLLNASHIIFPVGTATMWQCASSTTIFKASSILIIFQLRTPITCLFRPTTIPYEYCSHVSASNGSSECEFTLENNLSYRLMTSRSVSSRSSAPLTTSSAFNQEYGRVFPQTLFPSVPGRPMGFRSV